MNHSFVKKIYIELAWLDLETLLNKMPTRNLISSSLKNIKYKKNHEVVSSARREKKFEWRTINVFMIKKKILIL